MGLFGIRFDSHTLPNLLKNVAPVAGTVIGGPFGLAAAGGLSALGDLGRGKNIGEAVRGGLGNAALAGAGQAVGGALGYHGGLGSLTSGGDAPTVTGPTAPTPTTPIPGAGGPSDLSAAPGGAPTTPIPGASSGGFARSLPAPDPISSGVPNLEHSGMGITTPGGRLPLSSVPNLLNGGGDVSQPPGKGFLGSLASGAGNVADWASNHDRTSAAALGALGNLQSVGTENRLRSAQANVQQQQAEQAAYALQRQKAQDLALEPLREAIYGRLGTTINGGGGQPTTPIPTG
jgi:hypothetical protein